MVSIKRFRETENYFHEKESVIREMVDELLLVLREKCLYLEFFWSVFFRIRTKYGDLLCKSPYSAQMKQNMNHKKSKNGNFLCSVRVLFYK